MSRSPPPTSMASASASSAAPSTCRASRSSPTARTPGPIDSGTPRMTVDERTILQAAAYSATAGLAYGRASDAIVGTPTIGSIRHRQRLLLLPHRLRDRCRLQFRDRHVWQLCRHLGGPERRRHHHRQRERVLYLLRGGRRHGECDPRSADAWFPGYRPRHRVERRRTPTAPSRRSARRCRAPACRSARSPAWPTTSPTP